MLTTLLAPGLFLDLYPVTLLAGGRVHEAGRHPYVQDHTRRDVRYVLEMLGREQLYHRRCQAIDARIEAENKELLLCPAQYPHRLTVDVGTIMLHSI